MATLENRFSWSKSRHEKFEACLRQYYYQYYGSWGGWERDAPPEVRELYILKKLTNRHAWSGTAVHDAIRRILTLLRDGAEIDPERIVATVRASMRAQFRESREGAYRFRKAFGLREHEYAEEVSAEEWRASWELVESCLRAFFRSRWVDLARSLPREAWLPIDELGSFLYRGVPVFGAPDFAFRAGGGVVLVDWKTGKAREADRDQLLGYALYARATWDVPLERIQGRVVYLPELDEVEVVVDDASVADFERRMQDSIDRMRALLVDSERNLARIEDFPRTETSATCLHCAFRRPCLQQDGSAP